MIHTSTTQRAADKLLGGNHMQCHSQKDMKYPSTGIHSHGMSLGRPYGGVPSSFALPYQIPFAILPPLSFLSLSKVYKCQPSTTSLLFFLQPSSDKEISYPIKMKFITTLFTVIAILSSASASPTVKKRATVEVCLVCISFTWLMAYILNQTIDNCSQQGTVALTFDGESSPFFTGLQGC